MQTNGSTGSSTKNSGKPELSALVYGKIPPQAPDLEAALLGAIIRERERLDEIMEIIPSADVFYLDNHQVIYQGILEMFHSGATIDLVTLTDHLRKHGKLEAAGGDYELTKMIIGVISGAHASSHARIIMERYLQRELIRNCGLGITKGYDGEDVFDSIDSIVNSLGKLTDNLAKKNFDHVMKGVKAELSRIDELRQRNSDITGVNTGFSALNDLTGGWQNTDLVVVAARPAVGKTAFSINSALVCAQDKLFGGPVAMFNLEMSHGQIVRRMLSTLSSVDMDHLSKPKKLTNDELWKVTEAANKLSKLPIFIDDTAGLTITELRAKARRLKQKHGIKLIIIDYLQLMAGEDNKSKFREQEVARISRELKKLAKDLELPIIALSQMSREIDKEKRAPELSDLRESGAIEQDADMVMFLYRPTDAMIKKNAQLGGKVIGTVKKNRNGACEEVFFRVDNHRQQWRDENDIFHTSVVVPSGSPDNKDNLPF